MDDEQKIIRKSIGFERIRGEIHKIRFVNPATGFAVIYLNEQSGKELQLCGALSELQRGQCIEAEGFFVQHPDFGKQFRVEFYHVVLPTTPKGIAKFLGTAVPGIGIRTAEKIIEKFGNETLNVLEHYPKRLLEVPKIGEKKAQQILLTWKKSASQRDNMIFLQGLGITPAYCARLFKRYGEQAVEIVRSNPYRLAEEVDGIGFLRADAIAIELGFSIDSPERMTAAAVFAVNQLVGVGHVCVPYDELCAEIAKLTKQCLDHIGAGIAKAVERNLLVLSEGFYYTPLLALDEKLLPEILQNLRQVKHFFGQKLQARKCNGPLKLNEAQNKAVEQVSYAPLSIITGGPGVGKTTVVGEIVRRAKRVNLKISLAAPTGRAAKRLNESTGMEAKTIHRLLGFEPSNGHFVFNVDNQLECELLIVDEVSMLDLILATALFSALKPGTTIVLVGDTEQLPSVGAGRILADFIESGWFAVTRLTEIFRQSSGSQIITNSHRVSKGEFPLSIPVPAGNLTDFYWIEQDDPERVGQIIEQLVCERIPVRFGFDPVEDVQILTPMNRGDCGTQSLNNRLANRFNLDNHQKFDFGNRCFYLHDKVMQTANNYDKGVFNGDLGRIEAIDIENKKFIVKFDGERPVAYNFDEADQLTLAYAITIHKSQGSEFPAVILPLLTQHYVMLQRNLLYTGMTRAKKLLIIIGSKKAIGLALANSRIRPRYSLLIKRMKELTK